MIPLLSALAHHSEPADPVLMEWIKDQIDAVVGIGDSMIVIALAGVILAIPLAIIAAFVLQRARGNIG